MPAPFFSFMERVSPVHSALGSPSLSLLRMIAVRAGNRLKVVVPVSVRFLLDFPRRVLCSLGPVGRGVRNRSRSRRWSQLHAAALFRRAPAAASENHAICGARSSGSGRWNFVRFLCHAEMAEIWAGFLRGSSPIRSNGDRSRPGTAAGGALRGGLQFLGGVAEVVEIIVGPPHQGRDPQRHESDGEPGQREESVEQNGVGGCQDGMSVSTTVDRDAGAASPGRDRGRPTPASATLRARRT